MTPPLPARVRLAAYDGTSWTLGSWRSYESVSDQPQVMATAPSGSILVTSEDERGLVRIVSEHGWEISQLMTRIGFRPMVALESPLTLHGLPSGTYAVSLANVSVNVSIEQDRLAEAELR